MSGPTTSVADTSVSVTAQDVRTRTLGQQKDRVTHGSAVVGASSTPGLRFTITGLSLGSTPPSVVVLQPRQSDNNENDWNDEFAVEVIQTTTAQISGRVLRIDSHEGWGQQLRLDFLVIEVKD